MPSMSTKEASSSSSFSSITPRWKYDVFLNFRGEDTHNTFIDHLYEALKKKSIITFRDEEKLETGKSVSLELFKAIEDSMIVVVIFSKNYASSTWCLDELGKIVEYMKEKGMTVLPVFYDVDPSDVRKQLGTFEKAFVAHEEPFRENMEKVERWKAALTEVANLKGWHLVNRPESKIIQNIVGDIWHKLSYAFSEYNEDLVGTISRGEKLESCLAIGSNDVRIIGIWGIGGIGSRIIITTRDKHLLQIVDETYEIEGLNDDEALHLLSLKAFKRDHPPKDFLELSKDVVHYAKGLPLAIETLGSFLLSRGVDQWKSTLKRVKEFPESAILEKLKISYDGLHETKQKIFLYIACFFNHVSKNRVVEILDYLNLYPDVGLEVHVDKSLIKMNDSQGTEAIQGIVLKLPKSKEAYWNPKSFLKMHHLELLIIENVHLLHDPKHLPDSLRVLIWNGYSSKSFPSSLHLKTFKRMKFIQFTKSQKLIETLDFNKVPILEKLVLEDCINLRGVHPSIGVHKKLIHLCIKGCRNLKSLPTKLEMESLETLIISGCLKIKKIPDFGENMRHVLKLYLDELAITKLPTSIGHLTSLALLNIKDCKSLTCLPSNIFNLKMLKEISITGCSKLEGLPEILRKAESVEELDVSGTTIKEVPSSSGLLKNLMLSFRECKSTSWYDLLPFYSRPKSPNPVGLSSLSGLCSLTKLNLSDCNLRAIPNDIGCLFSLEEIDLEGNSFVCLPDSISQLCKLRIIYLENCTSLRSLPKLPLSIVHVWGGCCTSLEMVPDILKPNSLCEAELFLSNCSKLADNQSVIDMFFL
nr:TMV resistance protein N-like [Quercus suber]